jgi:hypothetical protein
VPLPAPGAPSSAAPVPIRSSRSQCPIIDRHRPSKPFGPSSRRALVATPTAANLCSAPKKPCNTERSVRAICV